MANPPRPARAAAAPGAARLEILPGIAVPEAELRERFIHAGGPGGQHVNNVATAVQLRFDVAGTTALPDAVKARLVQFAGRRLTAEGELVIDARTHRTREANRREARARLIALLRRAALPPLPRRATTPSPAKRAARLRAKQRRAQLKQNRRRPDQGTD